MLTTIHNPVWATFYLLIFGGGTMVGMMCMTATIAVPLTYGGDRLKNLSRYFGVASGMVSLCFGCFLVYQLGFLGGLFTSHPQWTPRYAGTIFWKVDAEITKKASVKILLHQQ